jgi:hypothetical protein
VGLFTRVTSLGKLQEFLPVYGVSALARQGELKAAQDLSARVALRSLGRIERKRKGSTVQPFQPRPPPQGFSFGRFVAVRFDNDIM